MSTPQTVISWICRLIVAGILFQTLFFKFTGAEESKYIFSTVLSPELEAFGRIGSGIIELVAVLLLLIPRTAWLGAVLALGTISGAIFSHLMVLGIEVKGDGGLLFGLAVTVFISSGIALVLHRSELPFVGQIFRPNNA
jgi:uncharacterized membrane protein YphA (DoxX/SURF4 family)